MSLTWVIGGTSGIGKACVELLSKLDDFNVIASGSEVDVRDQLALVNFITDRIYSTSQVDYLVYSAGINKLDWSQDVTADDMLELFHVNVVGLINALQILPDVRSVVVIGSDAAWREMRTSVAYCASKAALHQAVRVIARERASENFAINVVAPGMTTPTDMQEYIDQRVPDIRGWSKKKAMEYESTQIPIGRRAHINEIAAVVASILLLPTPYMNGAIIPVNGGR